MCAVFSLIMHVSSWCCTSAEGCARTAAVSDLSAAHLEAGAGGCPPPTGPAGPAGVQLQGLKGAAHAPSCAQAAARSLRMRAHVPCAPRARKGRSHWTSSGDLHPRLPCTSSREATATAGQLTKAVSMDVKLPESCSSSGVFHA